jgi:N-acetyl-anhydromuramyl-L-alanine amidase AmpD
MFQKFIEWVKSLFVSAAPMIVPPKAEPPRPNMDAVGQKKLWYPDAVILKGAEMPTQGKYRKGYPEGAIVHYTSGRDQTEKNAENTVMGGIKNGYTFFVIGPTGVVYQSFPLDRWGYHAGESKWPGLGSGVSRYLVGIEVSCAGKLDDNYTSWFGVKYPKEETRVVTDAHECPKGIYKKYTEAQEESLVKLLLWLKSNNPEVFSFDYVLGHHEVAGVKGIGKWRKVDPGGSLSLPMSKFRERLFNAVR